MSHPAGVRELKQSKNKKDIMRIMSHPTWVRELKWVILFSLWSHPAGVRGWKQINEKKRKIKENIKKIDKTI